MVRVVAVPAGEYFLTSDQKREQKAMAQNAQQAKRLEERARQREAAFVAPKVRASRRQRLCHLLILPRRTQVHTPAGCGVME